MNTELGQYLMEGPVELEAQQRLMLGKAPLHMQPTRAHTHIQR